MARLAYSDFLRQLYGTRVQKLNVNAGLTCPNRDGSLGWGGCAYCNNASFTPAFSRSTASVTHQLLDAKHRENIQNEMDRYMIAVRRQKAEYADKCDNLHRRMAEVKKQRAASRAEEEKAALAQQPKEE